MYKAQHGGFDLQNRKAKLITVMAVAILSIFILGCPTDGGPGPDITPDPVPTVESVTVTGPGAVTKNVSSNATETYSATVTGDNSPSQVVTWSIDGGNPTGVSISSAGVLTVESTANNGNITIKATSTVAGYTNKFGTKIVLINDSTSQTVESVTVTGASSVTKNASSSVTETYSVIVTGDNSPSQAVTWSIDGGDPTGVSITDGVLTVESTAATGNITIRATSALAGYEDKSGAIVVTINAPNTAIAANFLMEYAKLGLPADTYNAGSLITAMDTRATAATVIDLGDNNIFYNPASGYSSTFSTIGWPGGAPTTWGLILQSEPGMRWIVDDDDLMYYGTGSTGGITITFNVAVIKISEGTGWIYGNETDDATGTPLTNVVKETYNNISDVRTISISDLTNRAFDDVTGLNTDGYNVYIIVRSTNSYASFMSGDFNTLVSTRNVIAVHPEPTYTAP
jgi:hypothetical protein